MTPPERKSTSRPAVDGRTCAIDITDINEQGEGVGRDGAKVVFVKGAVPGDTVRAKITQPGKSVDRGEVAERIRSAAARRDPVCKHQAACGGCPLMVLDESDALALKARRLEQALIRIGKLSPDAARVQRTVASPQELRYRGRVRFAIATDEQAAVQKGVQTGARDVGYRPRGDSDGLVRIDDCWIAPEGAVELAQAMVRGVESAGDAFPTHVTMHWSAMESRWLLALHTPPGTHTAWTTRAKELLESRADVAGVVRVIESPVGRIRGTQVLAGRDHVRTRIAGLELDVTPTRFVQVNAACADRLYDAVRDTLNLRDGRLLDLYCGVGLTSVACVPDTVEVLGIEVHGANVAAARQLAELHGRRARFVCADAQTAVERLAVGEQFDALLANPPRAGVHERLAQQALRLGVRRVVLVSCHPGALARDVRRFVEAGFSVTDVVAVDMFVQTSHLEAVVGLERV